MIVASINTWITGSTGHIMRGISDITRQLGGNTYVFSKAWVNQNYDGLVNHEVIGDYFFNRVHIKLAQCTGFHGYFSILSTLKLNRRLDKIQPDIVHLHNIHDWYLNFPLFFRYIKKRNISVVWTLHDCWAFTGQCPCFDMVGCNKWKTGCYDCPQFREYPKSYVDQTRIMYRLKKKWFTGVQNMTIVTPSQWLAELVKQTYLKDYPVKVINNGIDLSIFKPVPSDFREKYRIAQDNYIVLGVAYDWGKRKGLDVFIDLSKKLDGRFKIVLVGTDDNTDEQLPNNIISIHRTQNQAELAEIYSAANVFVNPTREENFPTVNIESIACGTPVVTFNTGGSPEILDQTCGSVVDCDDVDAMEQEIIRVATNKPYSKDACLVRAVKFDMNDKFMEYVKLYEQNQQRKF